MDRSRSERLEDAVFLLILAGTVAAGAVDRSVAWIGGSAFGGIVMVLGRMPLSGMLSASEIAGLPVRALGALMIAFSVASALGHRS